MEDAPDFTRPYSPTEWEEVEKRADLDDDDCEQAIKDRKRLTFWLGHFRNESGRLYAFWECVENEDFELWKRCSERVQGAAPLDEPPYLSG